MTNDIAVGAKLRAYRKNRQLSLHKLAEMTGIAASNLSAIELGKSSPTLSTLIKLAGAFGVKLTDFLNEALYKQVSVFSDAEDSDFKQSMFPEVGEVMLTTGMFMNTMNVKLLSLQPTARYKFDRPKDHYVYCLQGSLELLTNGSTYSIVSGWSCYFFPEALAEIELIAKSDSRLLVVSA